MANSRIEFTGADGLIELLRTLPEKQLFPAINKGMRATGSKTTRDARKKLYKGHGVDTAATKKSMGVRKIKTYKKQGRVVMYVGPRKGFALTHPRTGKKHDPQKIAHLVEAKFHFLEEAVNENKPTFNTQMKEKIHEVLTKARANGK